MYFSTCNHYLYDTNELNNVDNTTIVNHYVEYNICFVCLEIKDYHKDEYCINLHNETFIKTCMCNGWIHTSCLNIWYNKNKNCPFCLCKMEKKTKICNICIYNKIKKLFHFINLNHIIITLRTSCYFIFLVWVYYNLIFLLAFLIKKTLQLTPHFVIKW